MADRLDGRHAADRLLGQLARSIQRKQPITLATILVGGRFDSALYVKLKRQAAARIGIKTRLIKLPANVSAKRLQAVITRLNRDQRVHGILLQLPLPPHLQPNQVVRWIDPTKDADGFHPDNRRIQPPPVAAVLHLLKLAKPRRGGRVVLLGKDSVFNQRLQSILEGRGFSVAIAAPRPTIPPNTKTADIVVTALGRGPRLSGKHLKRNAIVIDVGTRRLGKKVVGDADETVWTKAKAVSPVPGGVGPLTVAYLLYNTVKLSTRL